MPSFNPFQSVTGKNSATLFEIRLDNDLIVLRGSENEAASQMLRGVVVLCLPSPLKVEDVHLRMTGQCKVGWNDQKLTATGISNNRVDKTIEIFNHRFPPFVGGEGQGSSSKGLTLGATNYEWPFELVIPGSTAESIEGLHDSHIMYKLKATVARGRLAYDLHAYKPVRVIRTLDPAALELAHAMTVENVWPNKIEYSLVIPQKAIIFGTAISVEMRFTSLLKGLKIGAIRCQLVEIQEFAIPGPAHSERYYKHSRDIGSWSFELNEEEHYHDLLDDSGQDGYVLKETLPLPKSLRRCMQDCETHGIKIRHKVKFNVALHNPDGHTSELRATLPVTIFISPNMPLDEAGNLVDQTPNNLHSYDIDAHAPPLYGEHILDQLYAEIDPSGYVTPGVASGMNTPFYEQSRSGSAENLASMDGVTGTAIQADALSNRLQNLNSNSRNNSFLQRNRRAGSGANTPHGVPGDELHHGHGSSASLNNHAAPGYFDLQPHSGSNSNSNPLSRRTSEEDQPAVNSGMTSGQHTPEHIDFSDLVDLSKVPSYSTAVRQPARSMSQTDAVALPNYDAAVSTPPSPVLANSNVSGSTTPGATETPTNTSNPTTPFEMVSGRSRSTNNPLAGMGMTPINPAQDADAIRRLHLMQARGRAH